MIKIHTANDIYLWRERTVSQNSAEQQGLLHSLECLADAFGTITWASLEPLRLLGPSFCKGLSIVNHTLAALPTDLGTLILYLCPKIFVKTS